MSIELIESIINGDYVSANHLFEERLSDIREKKLYETKRSLGEAISKGGEHYMGKEDWAKYRKQTKLPKHKTVEPPETPFGAGKKLSKGDIERRKKAGYIQAHPALKALEFIKKVRKYKETGKLDETNGSAGPFQRATIDPEIERIKKAEREKSGQFADPSSMTQSSKAKKPKTGTGGRFGALRNLVRQQRDREASDWAEKTYRRTQIKRSLKNVLGGKNVMRNVKSLVGHGLETKPGKIASGALSDIASAVAMEE